VRRFWSAYAVSALGSGIGAGALPLVAILVVHASDWQVSLLFVLGGLTGVAVTVPLGPWIELHRKRPVMISADLLRFAALASVSITASFGTLDFAQLCAVAVVLTAATIMSTAASNPYLKALTPVAACVRVNNQLETTTWTASTLGPPVGGLLVSATSPITSMLIDAITYLLAAGGWRRIRRPEPPPPHPETTRRWRTDMIGGWQHIGAHPVLLRLFGNAMVLSRSRLLSSGGSPAVLSPANSVVEVSYRGCTIGSYVERDRRLVGRLRRFSDGAGRQHRRP
jgi:hypothetical protein